MFLIANCSTDMVFMYLLTVTDNGALFVVEVGSRQLSKSVVALSQPDTASRIVSVKAFRIGNVGLFMRTPVSRNLEAASQPLRNGHSPYPGSNADSPFSHVGERRTLPCDLSDSISSCCFFSASGLPF
jgi:hypothetical protein